MPGLDPTAGVVECTTRGHGERAGDRAQRAGGVVEACSAERQGLAGDDTAVGITSVTADSDVERPTAFDAAGGICKAGGSEREIATVLYSAAIAVVETVGNKIKATVAGERTTAVVEPARNGNRAAFLAGPEQAPAALRKAPGNDVEPGRHRFGGIQSDRLRGEGQGAIAGNPPARAGQRLSSKGERAGTSVFDAAGGIIKRSRGKLELVAIDSNTTGAVIEITRQGKPRVATADLHQFTTAIVERMCGKIELSGMALRASMREFLCRMRRHRSSGKRGRAAEIEVAALRGKNDAPGAVPGAGEVEFSCADGEISTSSLLAARRNLLPRRERELAGSGQAAALAQPGGKQGLAIAFDAASAERGICARRDDRPATAGVGNVAGGIDLKRPTGVEGAAVLHAGSGNTDITRGAQAAAVAEFSVGTDDDLSC